jgi:hypothetical protein
MLSLLSPSITSPWSIQNPSLVGQSDCQHTQERLNILLSLMRTGNFVRSTYILYFILIYKTLSR